MLSTWFPGPFPALGTRLTCFMHTCMFTRAFEFQKLCREKLKILLRTSCLIELLLDYFEAQFNHTILILHTTYILSFRSFVGEAENVIKDFLSD